MMLDREQCPNACWKRRAMSSGRIEIWLWRSETTRAKISKYFAMTIPVLGGHSYCLTISSVDGSSFALGPVYTKRQHQCWQLCNDSSDSVPNENNGVDPECVAIHFWATVLFSMRTESLALSQNCCSIDSDSWCKWALTWFFLCCQCTWCFNKLSLMMGYGPDDGLQIKEK